MRRLSALPLLALGLILALPTAAQAQSAVDARVGKLEREMRAVQRKVFPGGAVNEVEPQITAPTTPTEIPGTPSSGPLATLTSRVDALESQQQALTGQIEQIQYKQRQLDEAFAAYKRATDARLGTIESGATGVAPATPGAVAAAGDTATSGAPPVVRGPGNGGGTLGAPGRTPAATPADPARAARVNTIERPATGDAAEDGYTYGFRLWSAKLYPEAIAALKPVVDKYPQHRRASFAQNLIGRAYLDDGKPSLASMAFYDNYKKNPTGERAPDSLFYLADALVKLKKTKEACDVYGELTDVYGDKISASMKSDIARGRTAAKCAA
jgi:TolA-binding protein